MSEARLVRHINVRNSEEQFLPHMVVLNGEAVSETRPSYSQHGEDEIILSLFSDAGNLIEIGAWEPRNFSNSRLLIERGWDATLIEFSPGPLAKLVREYQCAEKVRVIAAAITPDPQHVQQFRVTDDAVSTNNAAVEKTWEQAGGYYGSLWVPTLTVRQLLDQFYGDKILDFVSVDTEGSSVEIAREFMIADDGHKPKVLCVEHDGRLVWLMDVAQRFGYRQEWMNQTNVILVKR